MKKNLLITGGTGALGGQFIRAALLTEAFDHIWVLTRETGIARGYHGQVHYLHGDLTEPDLGLDPSTRARLASDVQVILHAGAGTTLRGSSTLLRLTNVGGTSHLLDLARKCAGLERFLHISTTEVSGESVGIVYEKPLCEKPAFTNAYQQSKWEAEELVLDSWLPLEILRIAPTLGAPSSASAARLMQNPWHHWLGWMFTGYLPLLPAAPDTRFDFVSQEVVAKAIFHVLLDSPKPGRVMHLCQGSQAPAIAEVMMVIHSAFRQCSERWKTGTYTMPSIVDAQTFRYFQQSVLQSGHPIYSRVADQAFDFLPALLYPKVFANEALSDVVDGGDGSLGIHWRDLLERVIQDLALRHWQHQPFDESEVAVLMR